MYFMFIVDEGGRVDRWLWGNYRSALWLYTSFLARDCLLENGQVLAVLSFSWVRRKWLPSVVVDAFHRWWINSQFLIWFVSKKRTLSCKNFEYVVWFTAWQFHDTRNVLGPTRSLQNCGTQQDVQGVAKKNIFILVQIKPASRLSRERLILVTDSDLWRRSRERYGEVGKR